MHASSVCKPFEMHKLSDFPFFRKPSRLTCLVTTESVGMAAVRVIALWGVGMFRTQEFFAAVN
jgi:hypothetical protein